LSGIANSMFTDAFHHLLPVDHCQLICLGS
jgi:hypothetical protein